MATFSIFDDDRSATPDFFRMQKSDPFKASTADLETKPPAEPKTVIDHDFKNYRENLWRFPNVEKPCLDSDLVDEKIGTQNAPARSSLKRWYWRYNSDGTRNKEPTSRKQCLEKAPSHEQVHTSYRIQNASTEQVDGVNAHSNAPVSFNQPTVAGQYLTPPLSPSPSLSDPIDWASRSSSLSINETISEENRKSVARKQYYDRRGLLWECASTLLEPLSLHPSNLAEYEFVKLVCLQGYEIFQWLATNRSYLVDRAESQWHQAKGLLTNITGLNGLNANFMDDFLWMDVEDQITFTNSYRRLQLQATALREGVRLPQIELDALCMMSDEDKVATILTYKNEALETTLQQLQTLNWKEIIADPEEAPPAEVDNLYLKFLYGLGSEKHDPFQDLMEMPHFPVDNESVLVADDHRSVSDTEKLNVPSKVVIDVCQTRSEPSNSASDASNADSSATAVSLSDILKFDSKFDVSPDCLKFPGLHKQSHAAVNDTRKSGRTSRFSEEEISVCGVNTLPQLEQHKISYNDLRGLASTIQWLGPTYPHGETDCDEGSDWDIKPTKSLRKKASKLFGALKRPFTFSSRKTNRATVQDYFD